MDGKTWKEHIRLVDGEKPGQSGPSSAVSMSTSAKINYSIPGLSAYRLLPLMIVSIFCSEIIIMFILTKLPELPMVTEAIADATMLLIILSPTFYFFHFRPLRTHHLERKKIVEQLVKSEERLNLALDAVNDALWDWDLASDNVYFSPRWTSMLGYEHESIEPTASNWSKLIHPDDSERVLSDLNRHLEGDRVSFEAEFRMQTARDGWKWILARGKVVERDEFGRPIRMVGTHTDIHTRKVAEKALMQSETNIKYLSRQLIEQSEIEKKRVAQDLHDEFGQLLTALKLGVEMIQNHDISERDELEFHCARLLGTIDYLELELHSICDNLRPVVLDDLGLSATLKWLAKDLGRQANGTAISVSVDDLEKRVPAEIELVFYRVAQEAINNAIKHASAANIRIELTQGERTVILRVADDGCGFDQQLLKNQSSQRWGLGLLGMHERVAAIHGHVTIRSTPGKGTNVECVAPHAREA